MPVGGAIAIVPHAVRNDDGTDYRQNSPQYRARNYTWNGSKLGPVLSLEGGQLLNKWEWLHWMGIGL